LAEKLGHECVFANKKRINLGEFYEKNFEIEVTEIPKIEINNIPKEVTTIRFISSLVNFKNMELNIDEIVNPFTKDN